MDIKFTNLNTDEFFKHEDREDGKTDLFFGTTGDSNHNHAIINNGNIEYLRENNYTVANDQWKSSAYDPLKNDDPLDLFKIR